MLTYPPAWQALWFLRQRFAYQLATHAALNYALHGEDQTPENMWLSRVDGMVVQPTLKTVYSEGGASLAHSRQIPFRLTRNLAEVLRPFWCEGPFTSGLASACLCLGRERNQLDNFLQLFLRDDLQIHRMRLRRRAAQGRGAGEGEMTQDAEREAVKANSNSIMARLRGLVTFGAQQEAATSKKPCTDRVQKLIDAAQSPAGLAQMPSSWQAWM